MQVRAATAQDAAGIVALHKATNPYGDWYRNPFQRLGRVAYEDLTPFERYMHGGSWMDLSLFRRHFHEYQRRGFPAFIAEDGGRIVGECEVWLDEEPFPFGRYAEIEIVETLAGRSDAERELVQRAADKARRLGYSAIDLSPQHSGGGGVAADFGFKPLWDTRTFTAETASIPPPEEEFETRFLTGDYKDLAGFLAMNHREPARLRYEVLTARWPAVTAAGVQDATKLLGVAVRAGDLDFALLAAHRKWLDPDVAELDLWLHPAALADRGVLRTAFRIAVEVARRLGTERVQAYAPPVAAKALKGLGFTGGQETDPWLRWTL